MEVHIYLKNTGNVLQCNTEGRLCKHCCSEKAISTTYTEGEFVALGIQHEMRMRYIAICVLPDSKVFFHIIS